MDSWKGQIEASGAEKWQHVSSYVVSFLGDSGDPTEEGNWRRKG